MIITFMSTLTKLPFLYLLLLISTSLISCDDSSLQTKCSPEFNKLTNCLDYATGKVNAPSSPCCSATTDIRKNDPVCLCYIIQQVHAGSDNVKSLGIQFDRLVSIPTDCKMANTSASNCPKLLNLAPNSPDYNIFTANASQAHSTTAAPATNGSLYLTVPFAFIFAVLLSLVSLTLF